MKSNEFSDYYKTISNVELLDIIENSENYQPLAIEAAKVEFSNRQLSKREISEAKDLLIEVQLQQQGKKEKMEAIEGKIKRVGFNFFEMLNPIKISPPTPEKLIKLVSFIYGGIFLYKLINDFKSIPGYIEDLPRFPFESIFYLGPIVILIFAIINFWKRNIIGWILLASFIIFSIGEIFWALYESLKFKSPNLIRLYNFVPKPAVGIYIAQLIFLFGTLYVICKSNIREVFKVQRKRMINTIAVCVTVTLILMFFF
jgi:hypothetical protein